MATLEPKPNNDDHNKNPFDKETMDIKSKLNLSKQFAIRQSLEDVDKMSKEQLVSFSKYMIVNKAYVEQTYNAVINMGGSVEAMLNGGDLP